MISYELEELAERFRGMSEDDLLHDEELQGLSEEDYHEFLSYMANVGSTPRVRAANIHHLHDVTEQERRALARLNDEPMVSWRETREYWAKQFSLLTEIRDELRKLNEERS